jgi:FixJ family two-component response regulator
VHAAIIDWEDQHHLEAAAISELAARASTLTAREREVLDLVAKAEPNEIIAQRLGISFRTVEIHRSHIVQKLGAKTASQLIPMAIALEGTEVTGAG